MPAGWAKSVNTSSPPEITQAPRPAWPRGSYFSGPTASPSLYPAARPGTDVPPKVARPAGFSSDPAEPVGQRNVVVVQHLDDFHMPYQVN